MGKSILDSQHQIVQCTSPLLSSEPDWERAKSSRSRGNKRRPGLRAVPELPRSVSRVVGAHTGGRWVDTGPQMVIWGPQFNLNIPSIELPWEWFPNSGGSQEHLSHQHQVSRPQTGWQVHPQELERVWTVWLCMFYGSCQELGFMALQILQGWFF